MHPSSLLSYYPTYALLDEVLSYKDYSTLNIYIDLKNNLQATYMQHAVLNILENSKGRIIDTSVFKSLLAFLAFHKVYSVKRNININFFVFLESGVSYYHTNIDKRYKANRVIGDFFGLDEDSKNRFFQVLNGNYTLIEKACNRIPSTNIIRMSHFEADFIPYYLTTRKLVNTDEENAHVIYSNDHDLLQCIDDNIYIYSKTPQEKKIVKKDGAMDRFLKIKNNNISLDYIPLALSIIGDTGDNVFGIKGIGAKRFVDNFNSIKTLVGDMDNLYKNVLSSQPIFDVTLLPNPNKYMKEIIDVERKDNLISNNLRLTSFEIISRNLDNPSSTEIIEKRKYISKVLESKKVANPEILMDGLEKVGVYLEEDYISSLFYNKKETEEC